MTYKFEFSKKFQKDVQKLEPKIQKQIKKNIDSFILNPDHCDWIKLKGYKEFYRIRSGEYRIIFEKKDNSPIIKVLFLTVKHRKEVYKDF